MNHRPISTMGNKYMEKCDCGKALSFPYQVMVNGQIKTVCLICCLTLLSKHQSDSVKRSKAHVACK